MPRCWTCGSYVENVKYRCSSCTTIKKISENTNAINEIKSNQKLMYNNLSKRLFSLSNELENITSAIRWGFSEMNWQLQRQNNILKNIEETLKSPAQTEALELKIIAEELSKKNILDKAESKFLKSLKKNPLDFSTYIGLANLYLKQNKFNEAKKYFIESLPHAPKNNNSSIRQNATTALMDGNIFMTKYNLFSLLKDMEQFNLETPYQIIVLSNNSWRKLKTKYSLKSSNNSNILIGTINQLPEEYISCTGKKVISNYLSDNASYFAINVDNYLGYPSPKDYRSYSYRYLGHIEFCFNNNDKAMEYLSEACKLSPSYGEALYDYSIYLSLDNNKEEAYKYLYEAIIENPLYYKLAELEESISSAKLNEIRRIIINDYSEVFYEKFQNEIVDKFNKKTANINMKEYNNTILEDIKEKIDRCQDILKSRKIDELFRFSDIATEVDYLINVVMPTLINKMNRKNNINKFMKK